MVASILKQAAEILRKRKNDRRWQKIVLCLAVVAASGTILVLMTTGQALTKKGKVLDCKLEVHEHTDECYDEEGELVCGYADFVIHEHNDDCYDADGNLVCTLPEIELHEHDASCYEEQRVLICEEGKNAGAAEKVDTEEKKEQDTPASETPSHGSESSSDSGNSNGGGSSEEVRTCDKEEHTHGDSCYETKSCDKEEHSHDDGCYDENGELTCGKDEHTHDDSCDGKVLTCGKEEHTHSDECYSTESTSEGGTETAAAENATEAAAEPDNAGSEPAATDNNDTNNIEESNTEETTETEENAGAEETGETEETAGTDETGEPEEAADTEAVEDEKEAATGHVHTEECYGEETELVLVCEELGQGLHTHVEKLVEDGGCYDSSAFDEETGEFIEGSRPVCGLLQLEEHVHTEECFATDPDYIFTKTCEGEGFVVTAEYAGKAEIPEEAELRAELVEADSEHYAEREAEYKEALDEEHASASMQALMKIGFYMDDEEIEPKDDVTITVQLLDENGLPEGSPITVVHFTEEGTEVLDGSEVEDQSTTFKTESFCEFGIGYVEENDGTIYVSQKYAYEDDALKITFHVDGNVTPKNKGEKLPEYATDIVSDEILPVVIVEGAAEDTNVSENDTKEEKTTDETVSENNTETLDTEDEEKSEEVTGSEDNGEETAEPGKKEETAEQPEGSAKADSKEEVSEDENGSEIEAQSEEPAEADSEEEVSEEEEYEADSEEEVSETENGSEDQATDTEKTSVSTSKDAKLEFRVELLKEDSKMYEAVKNYVDEPDETVTGRVLQALTYSMTYDGIELDLSECKVTAEIVPGETLLQEVQELAGEDGESEVAYSLTALGITEEIKDDIRVKELKSAELDEILNGAAPEEETAGDTTEGELESSTAEYNAPERYGPAPKSRSGFISALTLSLDTDTPGEDTSEDDEMEDVADITPEEDAIKPKSKSGFTMFLELHDDTMAVVDRSASNPIFKVQYYAYVQKLATTNPGGAEAIKIIDTVQAGKDGKLNGAELPSNTKTPKTRNLYVKKATSNPSTAVWDAYNPVYIDKNSVDSLTKLYTTDLYEYSRVSGGLKYINKFAKDGMNYELCEVWVLKSGKNPASTNKLDWAVYSGDNINKLVLRNNNAQVEGEITVQVTKDTVIRLVGKSNTDVNKKYPARFFDYDFMDGTTNHILQGINDSSNYKKDAGGSVIIPRYGFGNNSSKGGTGLEIDELNGHYINRARKNANTIIEKCSYGIVESALVNDLPVIKANAPDLFNPQAQNVKGKTEISGRSLNFNRDGDTYTLTSVEGSGNFATNLDQFQKYGLTWDKKDMIWTNQFWPLDNAPEEGHDIRFGKVAYTDSTGEYSYDGLAVADDKKDHNNFFGMTFDVEFELTDDYMGPLNYYFFGDDDMWVFLEYPDGRSKLICDIGGVHQAAGEYVDLWNYIQMPSDDNPTVVDPDATDENRVKPKYKLKFFYTERGASGSTCWMQFTLPSVNAVPVKDYTGNVKNTLTLNKTVEGTVTDELFDFTITFFKDGASNVGTDNYPYEIKKEDGTLVKTGDIRSGGTFKLGHNQSIEVFNLPEGTTYTITETADGFKGELGDGSTGKIEKDKTIEGKINYKVDDKLDYINKAIPYELPETGGPSPIPYTIAGVLVALFGAGFMYRKKSGKEGAENS